MTPETRQRTKQRITAICGQILEVAQGLKDTRDPVKVADAELIETALIHTGDDDIFLVGDQPVLINWGCAPGEPERQPVDLTQIAAKNKKPTPPTTGDDTPHGGAVPAFPHEVQAATAHTVSGNGHVPPPGKAAAPSSPPEVPIHVSEETVVIHETAPVIATGWITPAWLGWIVVTLLLLALLWFLLGGLFPSLPSPWRWGGATPGGAVSTLGASGTEHALRQEISTLKRRLNQRLAACPPVSPVSESERRVIEEGGQLGDVTVTLIWNNLHDLDLRVISPTGKEVYYRKPRSEDGGVLDVDKNIHGTDAGTTSPVENIRWLENPPSGVYKVLVLHYDGCMRSEGETLPFQLTISVFGEKTTYTGDLPHKGDEATFSFTVP